MRKSSLLLASALASLTALPVLAQETPIELPQGDNSLFSSRVLTTGLSNPWEMLMGPDGKLWVTERSTGEVTKVDTFTGEQQTILTLTDFSVDVQHQGLLGMALHPEIGQGTGNDYVYLVYTYQLEGEANPNARLVRYTYDAAAEVLADPVTLIEGIPAGNDHNAGRIKIDPEGQHIFYSIGEQGANYGGNYRKENRAQWLPTAEQIADADYQTYSGKILRLNLDGSIPEDNPEIEGVRSHIYSYGHRNPQGLAFGPNGILYSSEHGPDSDDELNIIQAGGNYGWPFVAGYKDGQAYIYADWSKADEGQRYTGRAGFPDNIPQYPELEFDKEIVEPIATMFTVDDSYDFTANCGWICNPTIGPSSLAYYDAGEDGIAEWDNALLVPALKHGVLYVQHLTEDGTAVEGQPEAWFSTQNRYRDIEISGNQVFLATDNFGTASQKYGSTGFTNVLHNPGAILLFTYGEEGGTNFAPAGGFADPNATEAAAPAATEEAAADFDSLYGLGQTLFGTNCAACHGAEGEGAQGPTFVGNEDALSDAEFLASTIIHGFGYMPAFDTRLDDGKIAAVATYIRNSWGNEYGIVTPDVVASQR